MIIILLYFIGTYIVIPGVMGVLVRENRLSLLFLFFKNNNKDGRPSSAEIALVKIISVTFGYDC